MREIELLFKIDDKKEKVLQQTLKNFYIKTVREVDTYFYPPHKDFLVSKHGRENLRIRKSDCEEELTYKKVIYNNGKYSHSIEENVNISNANDIVGILKILDFRVHLVVEKKRKIYKNENFKFTIDHVKSLGIFTEIEWIGEDGDESKIKKACQKQANKIGLYKVQDKGYLRLIEERIK